MFEWKKTTSAKLASSSVSEVCNNIREGTKISKKLFLEDHIYHGGIPAVKYWTWSKMALHKKKAQHKVSKH